jgi:hypothetical protein
MNECFQCPPRFVRSRLQSLNFFIGNIPDCRRRCTVFVINCVGVCTVQCNKHQFWSIIGEKIGWEHLILVPHPLIARLAIQCLKLSQDELDAHRWVTSNQSRVIQNLEMIVDVLVKHSKTRSADINVGEVIIPCILPQWVQLLYHLRGCKLGIIWHVTRIRWSPGRGQLISKYIPGSMANPANP